MAALADVSSYLLQTAFSVILVVALVRLLLQQVRADYHNPVSQFVVRVTNPLLLPLRRFIPPLGGVDLAAVVLLLGLQMLAIAVTLLLHGVSPPNFFLLLAWAVVGVAGLLTSFYFFIILAVIILSWVAPGGGNPILYLLYQLTEPVVSPFRRLLPSMGGLDFSPILVFIAINIAQIFLRHAAANLGLPTQLVIGL